MKRLAVRFFIAVALVMTGWVIAKAQPTQPDFEIVVSAPGGETTVECRKGCKLAWFERGLNPNQMATRSFSYKCGGPAGSAPERCGSGTIGGWLER